MDTSDARKFEILQAVVRLNIETGRPVSSGLVERLLRRAYSSATIRAVMNGLEAEGYLLKPHASAGRLPTDLGYRAFVDRILSAWPLQRWPTPLSLRRLVEADLQRSTETGSLVRVLATLLSKLSASIGIILGPTLESVRAVRVNLYPKEGGRILMVLELEGGLVRTGLFTLECEYTPGVVQEAARILSERISGRTVAEIRAGVLSSLDPGSSAARRCARDLADRGRDLFTDVEEGQLELEGVANLLDEPEFSEPGQLKALVRFIQSPRSIREALHRLSLEAEGELGVWIGAENPIGELRAFSLLSSPFALGGRRGILAVLGPRRMPYQRAFSGIDVLRRSLQNIG